MCSLFLQCLKLAGQGLLFATKTIRPNLLTKHFVEIWPAEDVDIQQIPNCTKLMTNLIKRIRFRCSKLTQVVGHIKVSFRKLMQIEQSNVSTLICYFLYFSRFYSVEELRSLY